MKMKNPSIVPEVKNKATHWCEYKSILELTLADGKTVAQILEEKANLENKVAEFESFKLEASKNINAMWECIGILVNGDLTNSQEIVNLKNNLLNK